MKNLIFALATIIMTSGVITAKSQSEKLYKSMYAIENGEIEKGMTYLDEVLKEYPKNADAHFLQGVVYSYYEKYWQAITSFTSAIKNYKKSGKYSLKEMYHLRGWCFEYIFSWENAIADYKKSLKIDKKNVEVLEDRANLYFQMKEYILSDKDFNEILKLDPYNAYAFVGIARNLINQDKNTDAIEILNRVVDFAPTYGEAYKFLARAYDGMDEPKKAIDNAILYLANDNEWGEVQFITYLAPKAYNYMILKLTAAIKENSDDVMRWMLARGFVYQDNKDYAKAIEDYKELARIFGETDGILYYIGYCYSEMEDHENTEKYFSQAIELNPDNADYYVYRAEAKRKMGQLSAAIEDYTKNIELDPMQSFSYSHRGWSKEMLGDYQGALEDQNLAIEIKDDYGYYYLFRARAYQLLGRDEDAKADFEKIITIDTIPKDASCRAFALIELGQPEEAVKWAKSVVEQNENYPGNYYDLTCVFARLERREEAIDALKMAFEHGFRSFGHILQDDDMDNIREMPEFKALINEYKSKYISNTEEEKIEEASVLKQEDLQFCEIPMKKKSSGIYELSGSINDLALSFIFDTGASKVTISSVEANFMLKNNYLSKSDILNKEYFSTASGSIEEGTRIRLKKVKIGDFTLENIEATVIENQKAPLLMGQNVLNRFSKVDIDYDNMKIILAR